MSFALLRTTLRLSRWAIVAWSVSLVLYGILMIYLFPTVSGVYQGLEELYTSMPKGVRTAMGLTDEVIAQLFGSGAYPLEGYLATEYLNWWPVMAGIYAFVFCSGTISREVERGTMELLMSHPIPRHQIVVSKFVAFLSIIGVLVVASVAGIALGLLTVDEDLNIWLVFQVTAQGGLVVTSIASYSLLISCLFLDPRKTMAVAGGLTAALYFINLLGPVLGSFDWIQRISVFYYFRPMETLLWGTFDLSGVLVNLSTTIGCFIAALMVFQRRKAVV